MPENKVTGTHTLE